MTDKTVYIDLFLKIFFAFQIVFFFFNVKIFTQKVMSDYISNSYNSNSNDDYYDYEFNKNISKSINRRKQIKPIR